MNGITLTLRALHHGERKLEKDLLAAAERHHTEHEFHHVAIDLADWSHQHRARIAETGHHYGLDMSDSPGQPAYGIMATLREVAADTLTRRPETGLLLLHDLHDLCLTASGNSLYWEMLAQAAQATRDTRLLELTAACHPQTLRQIRWADYMIKTLSPQLLTSP
ncbi:hypothetical protein ABZ915_08000 [Streptomyces sp. NPDC046915]|uniref:hypothetical protein n=1 Tax=Streptomyces sp. NPDC046915 TaxID=3155257 RepID=UPI0033D8732E